MEKTCDDVMYPHLIRTLKERENPNLTPVQKRALTKRLKNQVICSFGWESMNDLPVVIKMVEANNWSLTVELLTKLLNFVAYQKSLDTETV
ncbi:hypothetical protein UFOVP1634_30 [uncultured Caudovirales phage]|uniref:Uncharacterized protein n=1 Tax=uncultured Caudovirales phage TaxID=2100421 RepID=A0A6J5SYQ8_9CAUD|nr:hypothetical protein UFOVP1030_11 [uncultured Caudovirales phage]CAB4220430.1 hypothetical protein UFOVP1634_30 [uncultured Caudovirales phage]